VPAEEGDPWVPSRTVRGRRRALFERVWSGRVIACTRALAARGAGADAGAAGGERSGRSERALRLTSSAAVAADGLRDVRPVALEQERRVNKRQSSEGMCRCRDADLSR
jgi:hypothetical protein